jgi:hypothetical protein
MLSIACTDVVVADEWVPGVIPHTSLLFCEKSTAGNKYMPTKQSTISPSIYIVF